MSGLGEYMSIHQRGEGVGDGQGVRRGPGRVTTHLGRGGTKVRRRRLECEEPPRRTAG